MTDVYDTAETLPGGELAKKRVKTTGQRRLTTERKLIRGQLDDDQFTEQMQPRTGRLEAVSVALLSVADINFSSHAVRIAATSVTIAHIWTNSTDSLDCLPILLSISVFYFLVFLFSTF